MSQAIHTVAVIGAEGQMGRLFKNLSYEAGLEVVELDKPLTEPGLSAGLRLAQLVLLAVPIQALDEVLAQVAPKMVDNQILADICSVKQIPLERMLAAYEGPVVGTHPLFGPQPPKGELSVTVSPGRGEQAAPQVSQWLEELGLKPFVVSAEEHDRAMAFIQGLNFVTNAAYLSASARIPGIEKFLTPSFLRRLAAAEKMLTQDAALFEALFEANPHSQEAVRHFRSHLNLAAGGDVDLLMERAGWWWSKA